MRVRDDSVTGRHVNAVVGKAFAVMLPQAHTLYMGVGKDTHPHEDAMTALKRAKEEGGKIRIGDYVWVTGANVVSPSICNIVS